MRPRRVRASLSAGVLIAQLLPFCLASAAAQPASPTFNRDVAPILFKNCASCHDASAGAAVSLVTYEAAKSHAAAIRDKVVHREMPPWPADSSHSVPFRNDARLSQHDIDTLSTWVDSGTPRGGEADLPSAPVYRQGWLHPGGLAPDAVVSLPEYTVKANGEVPYIRQLMKVPYAADKWIVAIQVRAGNRALLHHMGITEVILPEGFRPEDLPAFAKMASQLGIPNSALDTAQPAVIDPADPDDYDMLGVYTPGTSFEAYPPGTARLLKSGKNNYINFNIHYTTTGQIERDTSQLALWFGPEPRKQLFREPGAVKTLIANGRELLTDEPGTKAEGTQVAIPPIPAYADNYELVGMTAYTEPVTIYQFQPHAHVRAKDFRYSVIYPDGREQTVLTVPRYDFHWQLAYELQTPLELPAGAKLVVMAHYDNSPKNEHLRISGDSESARNCGPDKVAYFRRQNQSWDEMFSPFIQYAAATRPHAAELKKVSVVGCLVEAGSGQWSLTQAGHPQETPVQSTSAQEATAAWGRAWGNGRYELLGAGFFMSQRHGGKKAAVKGVLIPNAKGGRLNVTSLQVSSIACREPGVARAQ